MIRAKFTVSSVTEFDPRYQMGKQVKFAPSYDSSIPEDRQFAKYTPTGELTMQVTNPVVLEQLTPGRVFYLDFTPVDQPSPCV